ncbi:MAG: DUF2891 domain-containing protein, partial [Thermoanaerobaculia bacterium]
MLRRLTTALLLLTATSLSAQPAFDQAAAGRFAELALACVHLEYPNKIAHTMQSDRDALPPRKLTPAFYGCYDWHSSVHGHWLLARLARQYPDAPFAAKVRAALEKSLTPANVVQEVAYLKGPGRASFERPYGLAWLLQLSAELHQWDDPFAQKLYTAIKPLEAAAVERVATWIPKLTHPVRSGEHSQTAFGLGLMIDSGSGGDEFARLLKNRALAFYERDRDCPIDYEPSGEDFLSPCLAEADAMRRVMTPVRYAAWLGGFLPMIPTGGDEANTWLRPAVVSDPSDPKLAHLDG